MIDLSSHGVVTNQSTSAQNITSQYTDATLLKDSLTVQHENLISMLKKAETLEDILAVEDRLSQVRYQLDSIKSQLTNWDRSIDYSTVTIDIG